MKANEEDITAARLRPLHGENWQELIVPRKTISRQRKLLKVESSVTLELRSDEPVPRRSNLWSGHNNLLVQ